MSITASESSSPPAAAPSGWRQFDFARDRFAYVNELVWEYAFDAATSAMTTHRRVPRPEYALRCFVMTRAAKQFFLHARFNPARPPVEAEAFRNLIREVVSRSARRASEVTERIEFPGYDGLFNFSRAHETLLKAECGGAWRSYVLRSHWRMVLPISRSHQAATAVRLVERVRAGAMPILHLVTFPQLTINHGVLLYAMRPVPGGTEFEAYDPNLAEQPARLTYDEATGRFSMPGNKYWCGGRLKVIEIYRNWFF